MLLMNAESSGFTFIGYMIYKLLMAMIKMITGSMTPKMIPTVLEDPSEQKKNVSYSFNNNNNDNTHYNNDCNTHPNTFTLNMFQSHCLRWLLSYWSS